MSSESLQTLSTSNTNNDLKTFHVVVNLELGKDPEVSDFVMSPGISGFDTRLGDVDAEVYEFSASVTFEVQAHDEQEAVAMCKLLDIKAVMQCKTNLLKTDTTGNIIRDELSELMNTDRIKIVSITSPELSINVTGVYRVDTSYIAVSWKVDRLYEMSKVCLDDMQVKEIVKQSN